MTGGEAPQAGGGQCTKEFEGTFNLKLDKLNRVVVTSWFSKTLEHL